MPSPSTERRHSAARRLYEQWQSVPTGTPVVVTRANGETLETVTECAAFLLDGIHAMVRVRGIPGNTNLRRVNFGRLQ